MADYYHEAMLASNVEMFLDLLTNLTLLIALSILSGFIEKRRPSSTRLGAVIQGLIFGSTALFGMLRPFVMGPGLFFDGRSVMLSLCALFFGHLAALTAALPVATYRFLLGGSGVAMGVLTVVSSTILGLAARRLFKPLERPPSTGRLYLFGLAVHVAMLLGAFTIPPPGGLDTLRRIALPVMVLYPLATVLAGKLLADRVETERVMRALAKSEERFKLSMDATMDGLWDLDVPKDLCYYNPAYFNILGYESNIFETEQETWRRLVHPDDFFLALAANNACIEGETDFIDDEYRMRTKTGGWRWIHARGKCVERDASGMALRIVGTHVDITERKEYEERLRKTIEEKEILLREVHHRVKNNLNVISSLLYLHSSSIKTPEEAIEAFVNSQNGISAMSLVHEELYKSPDYSCVDMHGYLDLLSSQLFEAYDAEGHICLSTDVKDIVLSINVAIPCGLIMNELITNAFKYAYPVGAEGEVRVSLVALSDGSLELLISDDGVGLPSNFGSKEQPSLGITLVRLLVEQLHGTIDISGDGGTRVCIRFRDEVKDEPA